MPLILHTVFLIIKPYELVKIVLCEENSMYACMHTHVGVYIHMCTYVCGDQRLIQNVY